MTDFIEIPDLVRGWIGWATSQAHHDKGAGENPDLVAFDEFLWLVRDHPERAWEAILAVVADPEAGPALGALAAGPVEDLLGLHGTQFIDRVEQAARADRMFAAMLSGVWQFLMTDDIWSRVQAAMLPDTDALTTALYPRAD